MSLYTHPAADEYAPYYGKYIDRVGDDTLAALVSQAAETAKLLAATSEEKAGYRYAEGKWSVRQVIGHVTDTERVFTYRAMRVSRGDLTPLPGFDENEFMKVANFDQRSLADLAAEFAAVRAATVLFYRSLNAAAVGRRGTASGQPVTVRALCAMTAGHELHHLSLLRERYGLVG